MPRIGRETSSATQQPPVAGGAEADEFVEQRASTGPKISLVSHTGAAGPTNFIRVHQHLIREIDGKKYVYFQREQGGDWYVVELTRRPIIDEYGNVVINTMTGGPKMTIDVTGAKKADALTAFGLNHPADNGWAAIAKRFVQD